MKFYDNEKRNKSESKRNDLISFPEKQLFICLHGKTNIKRGTKNEKYSATR